MTTQEKAKLVREGLQSLANVLLELDASNESKDIKFTDADAMDALMIFNSVISNHVIHSAIDSDMPLSKISEKVKRDARGLRELFKQMTDIDPHSYYDVVPQ